MSQSRPQPLVAVYRFPAWEVRTAERCLLINGERVRLGSRAFDLLVALAERAGAVVSKRELMELAWPGAVVEENNLSVQVLALRKALGADAISNVSGHGYQLTVKPLATEPTGDPRGNVPRSSRISMLLGREVESSELLALVGQAPLVTVVGAGGVGKTALMKAILAGLARTPRDGVHWVDLSPLRSGDRVLPLVARALGVLSDGADTGAEHLIRTLALIDAVIALDNCEHVLAEVVDLLQPLLASAPTLRWVATSQEPLHLAGETVYRLRPLGVPEPGISAADCLTYGAVALFFARAQSADNSFLPTAERTSTVVELCRSLDGLPLAIEMAAARIGTLGLRVVREQLGHRLRLRATRRDAPLRQQTLEQTYAWSYGLLTPTEQCVFRRLEPFASGFTAQMAQDLCCSVVGADGIRLDRWAMLDALSGLVDKSLVQRRTPTSDTSDERLDLLESARDYARLQLESAGEIAAARRQHADVVAAYFDTAQLELTLWRDSDWLAKYAPERRNVSVALTWACAEGSPDTLARLAAALAQIDALGQAHAEILDVAIPLNRLRDAALPLRARALLELGWAHFLDGNRELGTELALDAHVDFETLEDQPGIYASLICLVRLYHGRPGMERHAQALWARLKDFKEDDVPLRLRLTYLTTVALAFEGGRTVERLQELHRVAKQAGLETQAAVCRMNITDELLLRDRSREVVEAADAMLAAGESLLRTRAVTFHNRAHALVNLGNIGAAQESAKSALRAVPAYDHHVMDLFARVAATHGKYNDAALLVGCSERIRRDRDLHRETSEAVLIDESIRLLEDALGIARLREVMAQGAAMRSADVLQLAFQPFQVISSA